MNHTNGNMEHARMSPMDILVADNIPYSLPKLTSSQHDAIKRAKKYCMEQSIKSVLVKQTIAHQQQQMATFQNNVQKQQALALMCRIYVGSINFEIREDIIRQSFGPFGPIKSINLSCDPITNHHKGFAFIEYEIPEAAQLSLEQMDGVMIGGRNIKVGRSSNMPQAQPIIAKLAEDAKSFNRIYVSSIHPDLTENDIKSVFEAYGTIRCINLALDPIKIGKHKGFAFIEYENAQAANDAVSSMNLFDLGGQYLRVGRAATPPDAAIGPTAPTAMPTATAVAAAAVTAKMSAMEANSAFSQMPDFIANASNFYPPIDMPLPPISVAYPTLSSIPPVTMIAPITVSSAAPLKTVQMVPPPLQSPLEEIKLPISGGPQPLTEAQQQLVSEEASQTIAQQENIKISGTNARHMMMQKLLRNRPESTVLILRNMVGPEDLDDALESEVTDECKQYGEVRRVIIYQERQGEEIDAETIVKLFVQFFREFEVDKAASALNRRFFGGRIVRAEKYDQDLFDSNDLSG